MKSLWEKLLWWRKKPAEDQKFIPSEQEDTGKRNRGWQPSNVKRR